jgi:phage shock protein C
VVKKKRLVRGQDRVLGGVCSGFAAYFDVDPTPVRIIYAVLTVVTFGVPGVLAYLVAWLLMPEK